VDRQYHVDDEACFAGLDAAALECRCQRVGDVGELDQITLGPCGLAAITLVRRSRNSRGRKISSAVPSAVSSAWSSA
jgi:hypothetical protein